MIKFRCKKKTRKGKRGQGRPISTKKINTKRCVREDMKDETYTACRTKEEQKVNIDTRKNTRKGCKWGRGRGNASPVLRI